MESTYYDSILDEAKNILEGSRDADYGDPIQNFDTISVIATALCGKTMHPIDCCKVLMSVKLAREGYKHKEDNLIDLAAYADILNKLTQYYNEK